MSQVTRILQSVGAGEANAAEELLPLVYDELRRLAAYKMASEVPGQTLQPTALVHEAWLRLSQQADARWQSREHFYRDSMTGTNVWQPLTNITLDVDPFVLEQPLDGTNRFYRGAWVP